MESHNGVCDFCMTNVPQEATICTGCKARWGVQLGNGDVIHISEYRRMVKAAKNQAWGMTAILAPIVLYWAVLGDEDFLLKVFMFLVAALVGFITLLQWAVVIGQNRTQDSTKENWYQRPL